MDFLNIHERGTGRQANHLSADALSETVSVWFDDVRGDRRVRQALSDLACPAKRDAALEFLGLELTWVA